MKTRLNLETAVGKIVDEVPRGRIFDSHFVINQLVKGFSDDYLSFAGTVGGGQTLPAHGQIGRAINKLDGRVIKRIGGAWSENIHETPSRCTCWQKV